MFVFASSYPKQTSKLRRYVMLYSERHRNDAPSMWLKANPNIEKNFLRQSINTPFGKYEYNQDIEHRKKQLSEIRLEIDYCAHNNRPYGHLVTEHNALRLKLYKITNGGYERMEKMDQNMKKDHGKPRLALVPPSLIEAVGKILTFGAEKYEPNGWRRVEPERYKDAMMRHMCAYLEDENSVDEESGYSHLWHLATNAAFLIDFQHKK